MSVQDRALSTEERIQALEAEVAKWKTAAAAADLDAQNAEMELRVMRRRLKAMEKQAEQKVKQGARAGDVQTIFDYWRATCGHERARLGAKRTQAVDAILAMGYTVDDVKEAIDGLAATAFEKDGKRYDDLELVCRNEVQVDKYRDAAKRHREKVRAARTLVDRLIAVSGQGWHDPRMDWTIFSCPVCRFDQEGGYESLRLMDDGIMECSACGAGNAEVAQVLA